jgi:hypothetical protein
MAAALGGGLSSGCIGGGLKVANGRRIPQRFIFAKSDCTLIVCVCASRWFLQTNRLRDGVPYGCTTTSLHRQTTTPDAGFPAVRQAVHCLTTCFR